MANSGIYTTALMDHNAHPDYKYEMDDATHTHEGINPSCGDELTLSLRVEDGVIEDVDTAAAYENAVANWHGGYDLEGDYTGEGEYDQNGNYVGSRPTEESIAANGSWLGGYMEDGSYTGYGQLDKDGNYVGPNPNETSEDGSEEELEDYSEDYSEDYNDSGYDGYDEEY